MKKYIFMLALLVVPFFAQADGGFLNVDVQVANTHGGSVKAEDVQYNVIYGDGTNTYTDTVTGNTQAFGFSKYTPVATDMYVPMLTYRVEPVVPSGYTATMSEKAKLGCADTIPSARLLVGNCTIYLVDTNYVAPVASAAPQEQVIPNDSKQQVTQEVVAPATAEDQQVIIALLTQLIELYKQLLALQQAQVTAL